MAPIPIQDTLGMLGDNLERRRSVLPISRRRATAWSRGLEIPARGPTVLYTGQMYQLVPAINAMTHRLSGMEDSWMAGYFGLARRMNRLVNLAGLMARGSPQEVREYNEALRNIARLLLAAHVEFGYLYGVDRYAGALAHDEGLDETLQRHAARVYEDLKAAGVTEVITVDPHTTNLLRSVYPKIVPGYELKVRTYLEVLAALAPKPVERLAEVVTVHDSCLYARREGVAAQPRALLTESGVTIHETELSGKATQCCGGPIEMLFPKRSNDIAARRVEQLAKSADRVVTLCPLCLANLRRVGRPGVEIDDVSSYLVRGYCPRVPNGGAGAELTEPRHAAPAQAVAGA